MRRSKVTLLTSAILLVLVPLTLVRAAEWQSEWEAALKGAKKEGKLVLAIPPSAELRKELEPLLKQKFGIETEQEGFQVDRWLSSRFSTGCPPRAPTRWPFRG